LQKHTKLAQSVLVLNQNSYGLESYSELSGLETYSELSYLM
jgi:hypothetical protein